ncbi:MAG TPA: hypothetical protein VFF44_04050 [Casimicrobiaceae bacterium]|nr:hypothetical protein [Casimicrobiaceae bacterium]
MDYLRTYVDRPGFLPSAALVIVVYVLLRATRHSMWGIALLALPGTVAHELAHLVVGSVLRAEPRAFSIWPRRSNTGWTLGSVAFGKIGLLNGAFVTLAPLVLLPLAWLCLVHVLLPLWVEGRWGWWVGGGYLAATALFAALPSFQDLRVGAPSILIYVILGGLLLLAYIYV